MDQPPGVEQLAIAAAATFGCGLLALILLCVVGGAAVHFSGADQLGAREVAVANVIPRVEGERPRSGAWGAGSRTADIPTGSPTRDLAPAR